MIKKIEISEEVSACLTKKCVKGSLYKDKVTGKIIFKAYNCQPRHKKPDILLRVLEHGWVKEMKSAKDVLIDRDIIQFI